MAAWISAETGVGPSMASGSQVCNGSCADLPAAPARNSSAITVALPVVKAAAPADWNTTSKSRLWKWVQSSTIPIRNAASPTRVTMNAFFAAAAAAGRSNQCPISRYEQRPTPSQPMYSSRKFWASTRTSMKNDEQATGTRRTARSRTSPSM